jgi:predicted nucleic-acid-binding protein
MAAIDDLILKIGNLIDTLEKKNNSNNTFPSSHGGNNGSYESIAGEVEKTLEVLAGISNAQKEFKKTLRELNNSTSNASTNFKALQQNIRDYNKTVSSESKINGTKKYFTEYAKALQEATNLEREYTSKRFNLLKDEEEYNNLKREQNILELDFKKETFDSEKTLLEAEIKAKQSYLEENEKLQNTINTVNASLADFNEEIKKINKSYKAWEATFTNANKGEIEKNTRTESALKSVEKKQSLDRKKTDIRDRFAKTVENKWLNKNIDKKYGGLTKKAVWTNGAVNKMIGGYAKKLAGVNPYVRAALIASDVSTAGAKAMEKGAKMVQSGKMDVSGGLDAISQKLNKTFGPMGKIMASFIQVGKVMYEEFIKIDKAASSYARSVGGGRAEMYRMRNEATQVAKRLNEWGRTAYNAEEILNRMVEASKQIGVNLKYTSDRDKEALINLKNFGYDDKTLAQFHTFGISFENASKQITELYGKAGKTGTNFAAASKAFMTNFQMSQNFTFARGQKAIADMALKSAQLKFNLRDAEQFANKVSTLEGAMQAGAQLSVLGGNFAIQGNPLAMMYNALNDVEGLQNQMLAMTRDMARWDSDKKQFEISAFDRERLKAMSQATGVDYSDLTSQALNQARMDRVSQQLNGKAFDKTHEQYIQNIAQFDEDGRAYVTLGGKITYLDRLKNDDVTLKKLKNESETQDTKKNATMGDVWSQTRNLQERLDDYVKFFKGPFHSLIMKIAKVKQDKASEKYSLTEAQDKEYEKLQTLLQGGGAANVKRLQRQIEKGYFSEETLANLRSAGILDDYNNYIGRTKGESFSYNKVYSNDEIARIIATGQPVEKASGGFVSGPGGPKDDAIPAKLSNGEFVVNADATKHFRPMLEDMNEGRIGRFDEGGPVIKNGKNAMKTTRVTGRDTQSSGTASSSNNTNSNTRHSIKIEFSPLTLNIGDVSQVIDKNRLANILLSNSAFVDNIIKNIGVRGGFGDRKEESQNKFLDAPFWA